MTCFAALTTLFLSPTHNLKYNLKYNVLATVKTTILLLLQGHETLILTAHHDPSHCFRFLP